MAATNSSSPGTAAIETDELRSLSADGNVLPGDNPGAGDTAEARFGFGRNWRRIPTTVAERPFAEAERPLREMVDPLGVYPLEVATPKRVIDVCRVNGFEPVRTVTCGAHHGCNEFALVRKGVSEN